MPETSRNCKRSLRRAEIVCDPIFQRRVIALHELGPRALAEFLAEIADEHNVEADIRGRLASYGCADAARLAALGGDRFPPSVWRAA